MRSLGFGLLLVAACAIAAGPAAAAPRNTNPAVITLLETAQRELGAGNAQQAAALLERALRIDPRNPTVWHYLGLARLELGDYAQAEAMAAKSHSLNAQDRTLRLRNARLMADAQRASGRTVAPTIDAGRWAYSDNYDVEIEPEGGYPVFSERREEPARDVAVAARPRAAPPAPSGLGLRSLPRWRAPAAETPERPRRERGRRREDCSVWYSERRATVRCVEAIAYVSQAEPRSRSTVTSERRQERRLDTNAGSWRQLTIVGAPPVR